MEKRSASRLGQFTSTAVTLAQRFRADILYPGVLCLALFFGVILRLPSSLFSEGEPLHWIEIIHPQAGFKGVGFDEALYRGYVDDLIRYGISSYPDLAEHYVEVQSRLPGAILPPTRFLYVFSAYLWHRVFGTSALGSLHNISSLFSIMLLFLATAFTWRLGGCRMAVWVTALMSCAPTQIHMAQHALIDGFFAFWATLSLWLLWENLRRPNSAPWLIPYTLSLTLLVLTKENALFAYAGLVAVLATNRWLRSGTITPVVLGLTVIGPLAGIVILVFLCGGADTFYRIYSLLVSKASVLPYAIATGDGPWYRYLVDLILVSPLVFLLAWGAIFKLRLNDKASLLFVVFVTASYAVMCNVRYGMNLRYTNMWDLPLRYLAVLSVRDLALVFPQWCELLVGIFVALLCAFDLRQYHIFFVQHNLYELVTGGLLHALQILK
jgi:4-amino-4-deoxy-L-arabinose transferase-like glycosyltransferase